jgi:hypothetical protein
MAKSKKTDVICLRIEPYMKEALEKEADRQERSVSSLIVYYLRKGLEASQVLPPKSDG